MESKQQEQSKNTFTLQQFIKAYTKIQDYAHLRSCSQQKNETSDESQQDRHLYKLFLIFGTTPSGKTLAQYYLCEDQLKFQIQEKTKLPYIIPQTQFQRAFINTKPVSITTRIPNIRVRDSQGQKVIFVQIPDVKQVNLSQKSVQYAFLQHLFSTFNRIHFLLVISHQNLQNADDMIKQVECVTSLFDIKNKSSKQLFSSYLSVIINKVPTQDQPQAILQTLKQIIQDQILQQNQTIGQILSKIIQNDRVYFIKSQTPLKQEQHNLFQKIIQQSNFTTFKNQQIQLQELIQLAEDYNIIEQMIQKQGIREIWKQGCVKFKQIVIYLLNDKRNEENHNQIMSTIKQSQLDWLRAQQAGQNDSLHTKQAEQKQQPNKFPSKLPSTTIRSIEFCAKNLTKANLPSQIHLGIQLSNPLFGSIKTQLENIIRCQLIQKNHSNQQIEKTNQFHHENIQLKYLHYICNLFQCTIRYIYNILNYNPELTSSHLQFKECIIKLDRQLLEISSNQMEGLDMAMFRVKDKSKKKGKSTKIKSNRQNQRPVVQATLFDLRSFFIKTINNDISKDALTQMFSLPNTAFKLLLLIEQYKKDEQFKDFLKISAIVRQICKILDMNKLNIEQIPFWAAIPDWNTTQEVLSKIQQQINMNIYGFSQNEKTLRVLGKLKHLLRQRRRKKLQGKCGDLIDKILQKMREQNLSYEYKGENKTMLLYKDHVKQLIAELYLKESNCQSAQLAKYPILVQKVLTRQKQLQKQNNLINQFQYLMSQDLLLPNNSY